MKKLISILSLVFMVFVMALTLNTVKAEEIGDISVDIRATFDNDNDVLLISEKKVYGSSININAGTYEGYEFAFWVVDGLVEHERLASTSFVVTNSLEAVAVFHQVDTHVVVFVDHSGKLIDAQYEKYAIPSELPNKVNYEHDGWVVVIGSSNLETVTENTVHRLKYKLADNVDAITINEKEYAFNEIVTLELPEGMTHWEEDGEVVAYGDYSFSALYDRTLVAKDGGTKETLVTLKELDDYRLGYKTFLGQVNLAGSDRFLELGLEIDGVLQKAKQVNPNTNEFLISVPDAIHAEWDTVRAYAIYKDGDEYVTIYDRDIIPGMIYVDFEDAGLTASYSDGSFVQDNVTFTYGHSRNEDTFPIDGKGLMLRRASDSYLEFTLPNGLSYLQFEYRKAYSGETARQLEMLINNEKVKTTEEFGVGNVEQEIYTFVYDPDEALTGKITIKIKNVGTTTTNRQTTIDNLYIFDKDTTATKHEVTFKVVDEDNKVVEVFDGSLVKEGIAPVKVGYTFIEWQLDGVKYDFDTPVTDDITLVAKYEINKYSLTLPDGVTSDQTSPIEHGTEVTLDITVPEGKVLDKLIVNKVDVSDEVIENQYTFNILVDINVDVNFVDDNLVVHTVTFNLDYDNESFNDNVYDGELIDKPTDPVREGYKFIEWQLNEEEYNFFTEVTEDITLVAIWMQILYFADFEGKTQNSYIKSGTTTLGVDNGLEWTVEAGSGIMWQYNSSQDANITVNQGDNIARIHKDTILTSQKLEYVYSIGLDAKRYGSIKNSNIRVYYKTDNDIDFILVDELFKTDDEKYNIFDNYSFIIDKENVSIRIEGVAERSNFDNLEILGLGGVVQPESYTVTFETNGGEPSLDNINVLEGTLIPSPGELTNGDLVLEGWYTDSQLTNKWIFSEDLMPSNNLTLYANWKNKVVGPVTVSAIFTDHKTNVPEGDITQMFGLDTSIFEVHQENNDAGTRMWMTANEIRLYSVRATGEGTELFIKVKEGYKILGIEYTVKASNSPYAKIFVDKTSYATYSEYGTKINVNDILATEVSIKNIHMGGSTNIQLHITNIKITYELVNP